MAVETTAVAAGRRTWGRMEFQLAIAAILLIALGVAGAVLGTRFLVSEWERDLRAWQVRLGIIAESRFAAVDAWLTSQFDDLAGLAENDSLQLYVTQVAQAGTGGDQADIVQAQTEYLRNLLEATAARTGFLDRGAEVNVGANLPQVGTSGIALLDAKGQVLAATRGLPPLTGGLHDFVAGLKPAQRSLLDLYADSAGRPAMAFAVPIFAVQGNRDAESQVGIVIGVKEVADDLYPLLRQPGETSETARAVLIRRTDAGIEYLSPLRDGTPPLTLKVPADTADLDAAYAIEHPGGFAIRHDYRNRQVLVAGRAFSAAPWVLMYTVAYDEALGDSELRYRWLLAALFAGLGVLLATLVAVWSHGNSRRTADAAARFRDMASRFEDQRNLLRLVTDSQPTGIFILDPEGNYRFANREAGRRAGIAADDMTGKPIGNVLGPEAAKRYLSLNREVLESNKPLSETVRLSDEAGLRVVQTDHIPVAASLDLPQSVLVVENDVTEAVTERERRARTLSQLVRTLVGIVDRRDPFAADHSQRVALLARSIAAEMALPEQDIETAETAGNLLNLGKILVAPELLTQSGELSEQDRQKVRHSMQTTADLLEGIEFDGPVVETLRQAQARWDGAGTPALAGDAILVTARIVAVANAFVGMVSRRAYREPLGIDRAVDALLAQVGKAFDRRVVAALIGYLDNHGGRTQWAGLDRMSPGAA